MWITKSYHARTLYSKKIIKEEYYKLKERANNKQEMIDNNLKDDIISHLSETNNLTETAKKFENG